MEGKGQMLPWRNRNGRRQDSRFRIASAAVVRTIKRGRDSAIPASDVLCRLDLGRHLGSTGQYWRSGPRRTAGGSVQYDSMVFGRGLIVWTAFSPRDAVRAVPPRKGVHRNDNFGSCASGQQVSEHRLTGYSDAKDSTNPGGLSVSQLALIWNRKQGRNRMAWCVAQRWKFWLFRVSIRM